MRLLLVALMIALLPVRAWLGDAMAMQMVAGPSATLKMAESSASPVKAGATFSLNSETVPLPCHDATSAVGHASDFPTSPTSTDPATHSDCAQCSTCQVCHSVALSPVINLLPMLAMSTQVVHGGHALFASAPRAPYLKPPIF